MSLFPVTQRNTHLVEFKAGKCIRENSTIKPDIRKGVIYLDLTPEDQLLHFYWKERKSSAPEDDFIIFPQEAEMTRVNECTTGRVYVLKFASSNQKVFYWMQSKDNSKDDEMVDRVNKIIDDPHRFSSAGRSEEIEFEGDSSSDLMQVLGQHSDMEMTRSILAEIIESSNQDTQISNDKWKQVQTILSNISPPDTTTSLELDPQMIEPLIHHPDIRSSLFPFVTSTPTTEELHQLIQSQAFQDRMQLINTALQQDHLHDIVNILHTQKDIQSFLQALSEWASHHESMDED